MGTSALPLGLSPQEHLANATRWMTGYSLFSRHTTYHRLNTLFVERARYPLTVFRSRARSLPCHSRSKNTERPLRCYTRLIAINGLTSKSPWYHSTLENLYAFYRKTWQSKGKRAIPYWQGQLRAIIQFSRYTQHSTLKTSNRALDARMLIPCPQVAKVT